MTDRNRQVRRTPREILFDIRTIIAVLFGVYGVVCLVWGLAFDGATDRKRSGNINVNLWMALAMLLFAVGFALWAIWRPLVPDDDDDHNPPQEAETSR